MQENTKQVTVKMTARRCFRTEPIYQYDVGHELVFDGFDLPGAFEVHFSLSPMGKSITQIGTDGVCTVPDMYAQTAAPIYAWLYIADTDTGLTKYSIEIPVQRRAKPTDQEPTPVEERAIDQAIAALNAGVGAAEDAQEAAEAAQASAESYAESAGDSAITATNAASAAVSAKTAAETAARNAATSATDAHTSREAADQSATNAGASERAAASSASAAAGSASAAAQSATSASGSASSASEAAGAAVAAKGAAETAQAAAEAAMETVAESAADAAESATTATGAATNAAQSASNASASATASAGSATAAAGSAQTAQDVLDSIPADYSELSRDVNSLKSAFTALDETLITKTVENVDIEILEKQTMKLLTSAGEITDGTLTTQNVYAFDISGYDGCVFSFQGRTNSEQKYAFYSCEELSECGAGTLCSEVGSYSSGVEKEIDVIPAGAKLLVAGMRQNPYKIQGIIVTVLAKSDANLADTYSQTKIYEVGEYCVNSGIVYRRLVYTGQAGVWDASEWTAIKIIDEIKNNTDGISVISSDLANKVSKESTVIEKTIMFTDAVVNHSKKLISSDGTITEGTLTNQIVTEVNVPEGYDKLVFSAQERTSPENRVAVYNASSFEECNSSTLVSISTYKNSTQGYQNEIEITADTKIVCVLNRQGLSQCDVQIISKVAPSDMNFSEPYDITKEYRPGEYCTKNGVIYKRKESDSYAAEEWTGEHWFEVNYAFEHEPNQDFTAYSDFVVGRINASTGQIISSYVTIVSEHIFKTDRDIIVNTESGYSFELVLYGSYEESSYIRTVDSGFGSLATHIPAGTYMRAYINTVGRSSSQPVQNSEIKSIARKVTFRSQYGDEMAMLENGQNAMYQSDAALMYQKGMSPKTLTKQPCILVAGQSNIDGRVPTSSLPAEVAAAFPNVYKANVNSGVFSAIGEASGNQGIDRSMYKALNDSGNGNIYIIKKSMGATAISPYGSTYCWTPWYEQLDDISKSLLYSFDLLTKKCIENSGNLFDIKAFVWQQGEGDYSTFTSGNRKAAFAYYRNFKALVAYVRGMAGNQRLPVVCGTVSHLSGQYDPIVEAATLKVAEEDPYMTCIDMSGATLLDAYHFDAECAVYFGYKAFDALIDFGVVSGTKINPTPPWEEV